ncbi:ATP-binding cassette domain-containing protein [Devosia sp. YIM 151766]|uniref:ABC transporter ATP-binding protein n=1 Tax=Devosia sp. YIM 151766 TaxID=3017325 RepID=UPI00255C9CA2|nr:oligopeptide/dipeptide ABC transporter ATP-binding protein [Devosia sp. YIM 151766]WIY52088.1 ATP-binding cassette domain-containing protein [Devosia sp. YIM 151766]
MSLSIGAGETLGLVGESGSGKSTIGRSIIHLVPKAAGRILIDGLEVNSGDREALRKLRQTTQMVFQDPYGSLNQRMKIGDIVAEPLEINRIGTRKGRAERVRELLDLVGLPLDAAERHPHEFSGGQRQRVGIARALAVEPRLLILDEPVAALDMSIQAQILQLLRTLQERAGISYLFIAHDLNVVRHVSNATAVMYLGSIVEIGPSEEVFSTPKHPYTQALISAIPAIDPKKSRNRQILKGEIPSPADPPSGCRFRTRCVFVRERCSQERPQLRPAGKVQVACHFWEELQSAPSRPSITADLGTPP